MKKMKVELEKKIMREPLMKKVQGDGVEIQLAIWGGEGKKILAVHGLTANCGCWGRRPRAGACGQPRRGTRSHRAGPSACALGERGCCLRLTSRRG